MDRMCSPAGSPWSSIPPITMPDVVASGVGSSWNFLLSGSSIREPTQLPPSSIAVSSGNLPLDTDEDATHPRNQPHSAPIRNQMSQQGCSQGFLGNLVAWNALGVFCALSSRCASSVSPEKGRKSGGPTTPNPAFLCLQRRDEENGLPLVRPVLNSSRWSVLLPSGQKVNSDRIHNCTQVSKSRIYSTLAALIIGTRGPAWSFRYHLRTQ